ncbi:MAG: hypothetical protein Q8936_01820 [Bacillota bacterium]|nr:hypothetical protein [Bacillota bacterium]
MDKFVILCVGFRSSKIIREYFKIIQNAQEEEQRRKIEQLEVSEQYLASWIMPKPKSLKDLIDEISAEFNEKCEVKPQIKRPENWKKNRFYD